MVELERLIELAKEGDLAGVRETVARQPALASERLHSGESPLTAALYRGHHAIVDALVELGAEVDVFAAAATGRLATLERALTERTAVSSFAYDGWTALHLAAFFGQLDAARMLLDAGAPVHVVSRNSLKNTPLHAATAGKHEAIALLLIAHGAAADVVDGGGYSPRAIAEQNGLGAVLSALDRRG